jgi:hypothetical protein
MGICLLSDKIFPFIVWAESMTESKTEAMTYSADEPDVSFPEYDILMIESEPSGLSLAAALVTSDLLIGIIESGSISKSVNDDQLKVLFFLRNHARYRAR